MGQPNDRNFDFHDIAVTAGFLRVSANVFDNANPAQRLRHPLEHQPCGPRGRVAAARWGFHAKVPGRSFRFTPQFPQVRAFLADIYDSWPPATFPIAIGSHAPNQNRWGDY